MISYCPIAQSCRHYQHGLCDGTSKCPLYGRTTECPANTKNRTQENSGRTQENSGVADYRTPKINSIYLEPQPLLEKKKEEEQIIVNNHENGPALKCIPPKKLIINNEEESSIIGEDEEEPEQSKQIIKDKEPPKPEYTLESNIEYKQKPTGVQSKTESFKVDIPKIELFVEEKEIKKSIELDNPHPIENKFKELNTLQFENIDKFNYPLMEKEALFALGQNAIGFVDNESPMFNFFGESNLKKLNKFINESRSSLEKRYEYDYKNQWNVPKEYYYQHLQQGKEILNKKEIKERFYANIDASLIFMEMVLIGTNFAKNESGLEKYEDESAYKARLRNTGLKLHDTREQFHEIIKPKNNNYLASIFLAIKYGKENEVYEQLNSIPNDRREDLTEQQVQQIKSSLGLFNQGIKEMKDKHLDKELINRGGGKQLIGTAYEAINAQNKNFNFKNFFRQISEDVQILNKKLFFDNVSLENRIDESKMYLETTKKMYEEWHQNPHKIFIDDNNEIVKGENPLEKKFLENFFYDENNNAIKFKKISMQQELSLYFGETLNKLKDVSQNPVVGNRTAEQLIKAQKELEYQKEVQKVREKAAQEAEEQALEVAKQAYEDVKNQFLEDHSELIKKSENNLSLLQKKEPKVSLKYEEKEGGKKFQTATVQYQQLILPSAESIQNAQQKIDNNKEIVEQTKKKMKKKYSGQEDNSEYQEAMKNIEDLKEFQFEIHLVDGGTQISDREKQNLEKEELKSWLFKAKIPFDLNKQLNLEKLQKIDNERKNQELSEETLRKINFQKEELEEINELKKKLYEEKATLQVRDSSGKQQLLSEFIAQQKALHEKLIDLTGQDLQKTKENIKKDIETKTEKIIEIKKESPQESFKTPIIPSKSSPNKDSNESLLGEGIGKIIPQFLGTGNQNHQESKLDKAIKPSRIKIK